MLIPKCQYNDVIRNLRLYKQDTLYIIKFLATLHRWVFGFNNQTSYFTVFTKNPTEIRNLIHYLPYAKPLRATGVLTTIKVFFPVTDYAKQYS